MNLRDYSKCVSTQKATYLVNLIMVVGLSSLESFLKLGAWRLLIHSRLRIVVGVLESQEVYKNY
jgi:hypothetical protein